MALSKDKEGIDNDVEQNVISPTGSSNSSSSSSSTPSNSPLCAKKVCLKVLHLKQGFSNYVPRKKKKIFAFMFLKN
jgi:hypothetical protein